MDQNRPRGRDKNIVGGTGSVNKRGSGLGTGPVGTTNGRRGSGQSSGGRAGSGGSNRAGGYGGGLSGILIGGLLSGLLSTKGGKIIFVILIVFLLLGGGGILGGGESDYSDDGNSGYTSYGDNGQSSSGSSGSYTSDYTYTGTGSGSGTLNTKVAAEARDKYTTIYGNGQDVVTIMVYMCGTDLESKHGMATSDMKEMASAKLSDNVNVIVYTGGCKSWQNDVVSSSKNQIYKIESGIWTCVEKDMGTASMTKASTLTDFIKYCKKNYPANRNALIFWDHGGGSLTGYGYDEKNAGSGSMGLASINTALKNAGMQYDFIGFDACLMATMENALMLTPYADYLIASEETEPGVGWYYTNWLTALSKNTSMPTIEVGQKIVDDFVDVCAQKCRGQKTTLSVVDLAELQETIPEKLSAFATSTSDLIQNDQYQTVSSARYNTREFAQSSKIDQVDLMHLAQNLNTTEGNQLALAIKSAVKYNRTSSNMINANGISIYFPYKKVSKVSQAVSAYKQIGMDDEYTKCIQEFASLETGGQVSAGGNTVSTSSPVGSLLGTLLDGALGSDTTSVGGSVSGSGSASGGSADMIAQMLGGLLSGGGSSVGMDASSLNFFSQKSMSNEDMADYLADHYFDADKLVWTMEGGSYKLKLAEDQWNLITGLDLNVFYDDGEGFIDLGLDNTYSFDREGNLLGDYDHTWMSINHQPVAYYHLDTTEDGDNYTITGYVPATLNENRVELILVFDNEHPEGYIAGARDVYLKGETETVAKTLTEVKSGDAINFLCDYYTYEGEYQDSYYLGDTMVLGDEVEIGNIRIDADHTEVTYRLTDIYQQTYWTPVVPE
ncbi:MAG: peptidase C11 [Lachnospiraceae bacterium]|nr:peptidase C11 [Lachnospiraceae bacterium]